MSFTVSIINIENNINNILLTDDLTIELLKVRYNWILNATIRNVVLGLDDYGLVWYMGEWICGEWEDGTWYSGIWYDGIWKNGRWHSYLMDRGKVLTRQNAIIEEDKMYSQFLNGKWMNGIWYNGIFGNDNDISGSTSTQIINSTIPCPVWYNGNFYKGLFKNSIWKYGIWFGDSIDSSFVNSYWINGKFYNGKFDNYEWWNGSFFGGDFVQGYWKTGIFNQLNTNILARFGTLTGTTTLTTWESGLFENGQFMSGYNYDDSGNTIASSYHNVSHWKNGIFNNGFWYGGHFEKGNFNYGNWYGGVFNTQTGSTYLTQTTWKNGIWWDGLWMNGVFKSGFFYGGMWLDGVFENGFLVSEYTGTFTIDLKTNIVPVVLPPPPPPPTYHIPIVTLLSTSNITFESCSVECEVIDDGGLAIARGICYSKTSSQPTINHSKIYDENTGIGVYSCTMVQLEEDTNYYVRAFASNSLGTSYSSVVSIHTPISPLPKVTTIGTTGTITTVANLQGKVTSIGQSAINQYGFIYSLDFDFGGTYLTVGESILPNIIYQGTTPALNYNTKYYFVAYATNSYGTGIGEIKEFTTETGPPEVQTIGVNSITQTSAETGGNIISDGGESITAKGICYSKIYSAPTISNSSYTVDGDGSQSWVTVLTGLTVGDTYYVRAYATNSKGTSYGMTDMFTCLAGLATVTTNNITNITQTGATCGGIVTDDNGSPVTARGVCWSASHFPTVSLSTKTTDGSGIGSFTSQITSLVGNTTYYVRAYATNAIGTSYGSEKSFVTTANLPTVTTTSISNITNNSAESGGNVTSSGGASVTARGVCWSTTTNPTISNNKTSNGSGTGSFTSVITGLANATTYYVRAYATNSSGTGYGNQLSFTSLTVPTVVTTSCTYINNVSMTANGDVTDTGGLTVTEKGICWSTISNPTILTNRTPDGTGLGSYSLTITGLRAGTIYHYRAYAINSAGTVYGSDSGITTDSIPIVSTNDVTNITTTGATTGGNVTNSGGKPVLERGIAYANHPNPTTSDMKFISGSGTGSYTTNMTSLTPGTNYWIRAYAINMYGTAYGNERSFTTTNLAPIVSTSTPSVVGYTVSAGGNVISDNGYMIVDRGVCWATHINPTTSDYVHDVTPYTTGSFSCTLQVPPDTFNYNTLYYIRAFAVNSQGTGYGTNYTFYVPYP